MESLLRSIPPNIVEIITAWCISVAGALTVLTLGLIVARIIRRAIRSGLERTTLDKTLVPFAANLAYYGLVAFVIVAVLGLFGVPTTSFVAMIGAAGLAIGLALQGTLSNFAAGVMLLAFRPFGVDDYVEVGGQEGKVLEIGLYASVLETADRIRVIIPNSAIWSDTIRNYTASPIRRNDITVGIAYGDDINRAKEAILAVLREDSRVLSDPEPDVRVVGLGDSSVDLKAVPFCSSKDYWALRWSLIQQIKERLDEAGVTIPFPQRDIHMYSAERAS